MRLPAKEELDDPELQDFWTENEKKVFKDVASIEQSNMKFGEKKYYMFIIQFLWKCTRYYDTHDSAKDLLFKK